MKQYPFFLLFLFLFACQQKEETDISMLDLTTKFESTQGTETFTYEEGIAYWEKLDDTFSQLKLLTYGNTDSNKPLHLVILSSDEDFDPQSLKKKGKTIFLINNAIHPGEPDGVEASPLFIRNLLQSENLHDALGNVVIIVIPFYNIGGVLNRNDYTRVNQEGPKEYGFRGNAQNYDLNRDFIKCDTENAKAFTEVFQTWQPDVFLDTHVSNGADYQHTLTNLMTQEDKLGGEQGAFLRNEMVPALENGMKEKHSEICPYVNVFGTAPDSITQFSESPRYSTGYTTLFHALGFMTETHMLKPFAQRVDATYAYMETMLEFLKEKGYKIKELKEEKITQIKVQKEFALDWEVDESQYSIISFKGYESEIRKSQVTGTDMLYYNREKPYTREIKFRNHFKPSITIERPMAYIIPQGWKEVIQRLQLNQVELTALKADTEIEVGTYFIEDYKTVKSPYEGHYLHYNTQVKKETQTIRFRKGDYIVYTNQWCNRYIIETLEPQAKDSFFNWNFFDTILQAKEGMSPYVFDAKAESLLAENPDLKAAFEKEKEMNEQLLQNGYGQLQFIYQNSKYAENVYLRYPVFRMENEQQLHL